MITTTPIQQPAMEDLRNAIQIAESWQGDFGLPRETSQAWDSMARLIRHALEQLSEPTPSMIVALRSIVESHSSLMTQHESAEEMDRYWRDSAAIVLRAAVTGFTSGLGASVAVHTDGQPRIEGTGP